ncbi:MAG: DUF285 domain-containing protein [Bacteroidales bacterium]|nr:DUF285 domain-containing protein [Bacteroidales bacterium]
MAKLYLMIIMVQLASVKIWGNNDFITTWAPAGGTITIPTNDLYDYMYNYNIEIRDANDGLIESAKNVKTSYTSGVLTDDIVTVKISGDFPHIFFYNSSDKDKILTIEQWGDIKWGSMSQAFYGCTNLTSNAADVPDLSNVTVMGNMFRGARNYNGSTKPGGHISNWDVSNVERMNNMFRDATAFNQDISKWDVSNVQTMSYMFMSANSYNNGGQPLNWGAKTAKVGTMEQMFRSNDAFNQDISGWDISSVKNLNNMFRFADGFNNAGQPLDWGNKTSQVKTMRYMFYKTSGFDQDISGWNISSLTDAIGMLDYCGMSPGNYDALLTGWNQQVQASLGTTNEIVNVDFGAEKIKYCMGGTARKQLIDAGWGDGVAGEAGNDGDYIDIVDGGRNVPDQLQLNDFRIKANANTIIDLTKVVQEEELVNKHQSVATNTGVGHATIIQNSWQVVGRSVSITNPGNFDLSPFYIGETLRINFGVEEEHCGTTVTGTAALYIIIRDEFGLPNKYVEVCAGNHIHINLYSLMGYYGRGQWELLSYINSSGNTVNTMPAGFFTKDESTLPISRLVTETTIGSETTLVFKYTPGSGDALSNDKNTGITLTIELTEIQ